MRQPSAAPATFDPRELGLPSNLTEQIQFVDLIAGSDLVPKALQGKTANCFLILQKAIALGLPWDVAMSGIHVIENKVTCGAKLLRMLMHRAGHVFFPHTVTDKEVRATLTLAHRPTEPIEIQYTIAEAQTAGLTGKQVWKNYGKSMLMAAAARRAVDWYCPEIVLGIDISEDTLAESFGETSGTVQANATIVRDTAPESAIPRPRAAGDDQPAAQEQDTAAPEPEDDPKQALAREALDKAREAVDVATLTRLGKDARSKQLLEQVVDTEGTTLKDALMTRMREVESGQAATA